MSEVVLKTCTKCKETKAISEFPADKRLVCGHRASCIECNRKRHRDFYKANHSEQLERIRKNHTKNRVRESTYRREHYIHHPKIKSSIAHLFSKSKKEYKYAYGKIYKEKNIQKCREAQRKHNNKKRATIEGKLNHRMSSRILFSLKGNKNNNWQFIVGYTIQDLKCHLQNQFKNGMSWENFGKWHIDHIIPISFFKFKSYNDVEFRMCWRLENLQPLWAIDNIRKNNKLEYKHVCSF